MIDFTMKQYSLYLLAIKKNFKKSITFNNFFSKKPNKKFCIIRHDVDRKPKNALKMAELENYHGVKSTYYFRTKKGVFNKKIIKQIYSLGHEIGYHYESLSDTNGDFEKALEDFTSNLKNLRKIVPITTISMHGRPLSPYDNRDIWKNPYNNKILKNKLKIKGEVYLDIDYSDILYISDTGRNWDSSKDNIRDTVYSNISEQIKSSSDLIKKIQTTNTNMIILTHPERWSNSYFDYSFQLTADLLINTIKKAL
jgi:hypothetical protein